MIPRTLAVMLVLSAFAARITAEDKSEPVRPTQAIALFNGKDLAGLYPWLRDTKGADPRKVFSVHDGMIHISGEGFGYLATDRPYRDYHVTVEYRWGKRTDGGKYVRNSGILMNAVGPDGGAGKGAWMSSIECQLAQGCVGDMIVIRGKDEKQQDIPVRLKADVEGEKRARWKLGGTPREFTNRQLWWSNHDLDFEELLDTRGKNDVESPVGDWTRVDCVCVDKTITIHVNGTAVNQAYDVFPPAGKLLLQCEGFELFVRRFEVKPAK